jgi:D-ribose pyranose/furanose isomerase RbsD
MNNTIKVVALGAILSLALSQTAIASEKKVEKKITIEDMEVKLAILAKEISEEKVKLYQKEALLNDMKLDLLKQKMKK